MVTFEKQFARKAMDFSMPDDEALDIAQRVLEQLTDKGLIGGWAIFELDNGLKLPRPSGYPVEVLEVTDEDLKQTLMDLVEESSIDTYA